MKIDKHQKPNYKTDTKFSEDAQSYYVKLDPNNISLVDAIEGWVSSECTSADYKDKIVKHIMNYIERLVREIQDHGYEVLEDDSAFGNDAEYWHEQYEHIISLKDMIDHDLSVKVRTEHAINQSLKESRDSWKAKYGQVCRELEELNRSLPEGLTWPCYSEDGKPVNVGDKVKVYETDSEPIQDIVTAIIVCKNNKIKLELGYKLTDPKIIQHADPDTILSIINEAVEYGKTLDKESEGTLSDEEYTTSIYARILDIINSSRESQSESEESN